MKVTSLLVPHQISRHAVIVNPCLKSETWGTLHLPRDNSAATHHNRVWRVAPTRTFSNHHNRVCPIRAQPSSRTGGITDTARKCHTLTPNQPIPYPGAHRSTSVPNTRPRSPHHLQLLPPTSLSRKHPRQIHLRTRSRRHQGKIQLRDTRLRTHARARSPARQRTDGTRLATAINVLKFRTSKQLKAGRKQFWQRATTTSRTPMNSLQTIFTILHKKQHATLRTIRPRSAILDTLAVTHAPRDPAKPRKFFIQRIFAASALFTIFYEPYPPVS